MSEVEKRVGKRMTAQRRAMLQCLEEAGRPLSVEEIHEHTRNTLPSIGLRTIYRNLRELVEEHALIGVDYPGQPTRYEGVTGRNRPHFICRTCNRMFVLEKETPEITYAASEPFSVEWAEIIFYGTCNREDCRPEEG